MKPRVAEYAVVVPFLIFALVVAGTVMVARERPDPARARSQMTKTIVQTIVGEALGRFKEDLGRKPVTLNELFAAPAAPDRAAWRGPYLENAGLLQDAWGCDLHYRFPGLHNPGGYDLWSDGPDGQDGTDDDITNWGD
jgi:general secretion pathway protein G